MPATAVKSPKTLVNPRTDMSGLDILLFYLSIVCLHAIQK
jgi:hypothetical protein